MKLLLFCVIIIGSFLFIGSPNDYTSRLIKEIWESGHFFLFAGLVFYLLHSKPLKSKSPISLLLITILFCICVGLITELLQIAVGRNFEFKDILNDLIGGMFGLFLFQFIQQKKKLTRLSIMIVTIMLGLLGVRSLVFALVDDYLMKSDFPILSRFETPFELSRWDTQLADLSISKMIKKNGKQSMQVNFLPGKYPDITLKYFQGDWQGFERLQISIFSDSDQPFEMNFKIYDATHITSNYQFSDRFNSEIMLYPGWNQIEYLLNDVKNQPKTRVMDLSSIVSVSLFLIDLNHPLTIYIDDVSLLKIDDSK